MKLKTFDEYWGSCGVPHLYDIHRELRYVQPHGVLNYYETGEVVVTTDLRNQNRYASSPHNFGIVSVADRDCPQLATVDGTLVKPADLAAQVGEAQHLLLDWDRRVAVLLQSKRGRGMYGQMAYYPSPDALPVPNAPIVVATANRSRSIAANKRLKQYQNAASLMLKFMPTNDKPRFYYLEPAVQYWIKAIMASTPAEKALQSRPDPESRYPLTVLGSASLKAKLSVACRDVTEHTYLNIVG